MSNNLLSVINGTLDYNDVNKLKIKVRPLLVEESALDEKVRSANRNDCHTEP